MAIDVVCPECSRKHTLPDSTAGRTFRCKNCDEPIEVSRSASRRRTPEKRRRTGGPGNRRSRGARRPAASQRSRHREEAEDYDEVEVVDDVDIEVVSERPSIPTSWVLGGSAAALLLIGGIAVSLMGSGGDGESTNAAVANGNVGSTNAPANIPAAPVAARPPEPAIPPQEKIPQPARTPTLAEANTLRNALRFDEAATAYRSIIEERLEEHAPHAAETLEPKRLLARTLRLAGRFPESIEVWRECVDAERSAVRPAGTPVPTDVEDLAWTICLAGDSAGARRLLERAIETRGDAHGPRHDSVASAEHVLGRIARSEDDISASRDHFERAYEIRAAQSAASLERLRTSVALAETCRHELDYHSAREVLETAQRDLGRFRTHPLAARVEWLLAKVYGSSDRSADEERLERQAERTFQLCRERDDEAAVALLRDFGDAKRRDDEYIEAERDFQEAISIANRVHGPESLVVAGLKRRIGESLAARHSDAAAETELRAALKMAEARCSENDPRLVRFHVELAETLAERRRSDEALVHLDRATTLLKSKPRPGPSDFTVFMRKATTLHAVDRSKSLAAFDDSVRYFHRTLLRTLPKLADDRKYSFARVQDLLLGFPFTAARLNASDQQWVDRSAEWVVNMKGLVVEAMVEQTTLVRETSDPTTKRLGDDLIDVRNRLARFSNTFGPKGSTVNGVEIAQLSRRERELVAELVERTPEVDPVARWVSLDAIRAAMGDDTVLVEIWDATQIDLVRSRGMEPHFLAWIIPPTGKGNVRLVDLGPSSRVHRQVSRVRSALKGTHLLFASDTIKESEAIAEYDRVATEAYGVVLGALDDHIADYERWLIAPDSSLWVLPWSALRAPDGKYVCEKWELGNLVTARTLLRERNTPSRAKPVVFAEPDYNVGLAGEPDRPLFSELPGTAKEANIIVPRIRDLHSTDPDLWKGEEATEERIKKLSGPPLLVLSTHGYFAPSRGSSGNPLLDCGLALAGANGVTDPLAASKPGEDGLLTGLEVAGLDLQGTGLVVLSACETGLGKLEAGQGVAGLQQGFRLAGAETVMSSLWPIPDRETVFFMSRYFTYLSEGRTRTAALREAQMAVIKIRRRRYKASHPIYWASFTVTGIPD